MDNMTAKMSCFVRAYHHLSSETHVFDDAYAAKILGENYGKISANLSQGVKFFLPEFSGTKEEGIQLIVEKQLAPSVLGRSAYCEKMLQNEILLGCRQYLLFGAGYDTYFARKQESDLTVFELDYPEMIKEKNGMMKEAGIEGDLVQIACDLSQRGWEILLQNQGYNPVIKSFGSLLGLTYYLEKTSFVELLSKISQLMTIGSAICFDYQTKEESKVTTKNSMLAASAGEQMKSVYSLDELQLMLEDVGFSIYEHLDDNEMTRQFFSDYNRHNTKHEMHAPKGVGYVFAVKNR